MRNACRPLGLGICLAALLLPSLAQAAKPAADPKLFESLAWREVGPFRGGRAAAVAGVPSQPQLYYFGATGGGVWKTIDGGVSWKNVSDGFFGGSIGAVAVSEWDPNVVYVGGGEVTVRGNVSHGDGVWKSTDAGKTWTHRGLPDSRHIPRIVIHPKNPDVVYAAVLGHLFGPNDERGVYRSKDGGKNWQRILFANRDAGAVDLILDPTNPRILYASTWRVRRTPWSLESGGEGSGLWKSTDGGDSWKELSRNPGLPKGTLGIIGITVSPSNPQNLYAIVEAEEGGVFRSADGGDTWTLTSDSRDLRQRAWYYSRIYADPKDEDALWVVNVGFFHSKDGGKSFAAVDTPHSDNHDLWIAPDDPLRMVEANDGGANVSRDGGRSWSPQDNQPTAQFYRVSTDDDFPYRLLGAQQDNSAVRIRHRSGSGGAGIGTDDWEPTAGGESGWIAAQPKNPDRVFGGSYGGLLTWLDHRSGQYRDVNPWPDNPMGAGAADLKYRFQWNFPLFFSPHPPHALYAAANVLFRSTDQGASWTAVSPDLTRDDKSKQGPSGGPITKDNTSVEYYGTIFAAAESPREPGLLWAGSDDGRVHLSRDNGKSWTEVTPKGMPQWIQVNSLEVSPWEDGALYLAGTMYKWDDFRPYLYRTRDYGKTWTRIDAGIPAGEFTRVIRADPGRRGLLYAGTEKGVWVSFDDGGHWQSLQLKLPVVPITDLAIKDGDLIAATQGRSFWILDDLTVLHQLKPEAIQPTHLFTPRPAWRIDGSGRKTPANQGTNPPNGVVVHYRLGDLAPKTPVKLAFLQTDGTLIREFQALTPDPSPASGRGEPEKEEDEAELSAAEKKKKEKAEEEKLPAAPGMQRFAWDLRLPEADDFEGIILWGGGLDGPRVPPGQYRVRLTAGETTQTADFEVRADPRSQTSQADLEAQYVFLREIHDKVSEVHREIVAIREVREELTGLRQRLPKDSPLRQSARDLDRAMTAVEEALYQTKNRSEQDPLNFPIRLNDKLVAVGSSAAAGDHAPTAQQLAVRQNLLTAIDSELAKLRTIWEKDLPALNRQVKEAGADAIVRKK